jgi:hypothetical protein
MQVTHRCPTCEGRYSITRRGKIEIHPTRGTGVLPSCPGSGMSVAAATVPAEYEGQASTFLTRVVVLFIQAAIIGAVGGLVATALIMIVRVGQ